MKVAGLVAMAATTWTLSALAQQTGVADPYAPVSGPLPDASALVKAPTIAVTVPTIPKPTDATNVTLSAGGLLTNGNSRLLALTTNGNFAKRVGYNGYGASLLGNYGQGAPLNQAIQVTAENLQGRFRYDRYLTDDFTIFMVTTARHDKFQGIAGRLNIDPGVKYLFVRDDSQALWGEAGYDMQYDNRLDSARDLLNANGIPILDAAGNPILVDKTLVDHSGRLFVGYRHAFNKEVTLSTGLEYLQSGVILKRARVNFDGLFAAKIIGGIAVGLGLSSRFDNNALPGKAHQDTSATLSLIYSYSSPLADQADAAQAVTDASAARAAQSQTVCAPCGPATPDVPSAPPPFTVPTTPAAPAPPVSPGPTNSSEAPVPPSQ